MHANLIHQRLHNQRLIGSPFNSPDDVVRWFGAVQAQDYLGALWGVGMRVRDATEAVVEQAIAERKIIRTWPMRSTLHFVPPEDVRWMLKLLTPRVVARSETRYRQLELDDAVFTRSRKLLEKALQGGMQLSRDAMYKVLHAEGISTSESRGLHILGRLAQDGVICFGPREGKQQTFVLLEEWVPAPKEMDRESGLAAFAKRYFTAHGPATLRDFVWWSGLTVTDARAGLELVKASLAEERINGQSYWLPSSTTSPKHTRSTANLLPSYDEYTVGYKDRSALIDEGHVKLLDPVRSIFNPTIAINGRIVGTWKRVFEKKSVVISPVLFTGLKAAEQRALRLAAERYGQFIGLPVVMK
jgi:Winged helix DNA-binding domain